jgi:hypothetical protein
MVHLGQPEHMLMNVALSRLASTFRAGHGTSRNQRTVPDIQPLVLYEYESCPMCRRVREAFSELALPVEVRPCPRGGTRFRPEAVEKVGRARFPFLIDPNTGVETTESDRIVTYLYETYGDGEAPPTWLFGPSFVLTSQLASMSRGTSGFRARPSVAPEEPLVLHGDEADPAARLVRERLCELELPYLRLPGELRLVDPNTNADLRELPYILAHLTRWVSAT